MAKQRIIVLSVLSFSLMVFTGQTLSQMRSGPPPLKPGMTEEEAKKAIEKWEADRRLQRRKLAHEHIRLMAREAWKHELRVSERQWRIIEPKDEREELVSWTTRTRAGCGVRDYQTFYWRKPTEDRGGGWPPPKTPEELTEGQRIVCELIDLMRQEDPSDEELRQKIDALQQVREKARKEWPKAKRELAAVLTTPRQEAIFLIMGRID